MQDDRQSDGLECQVEQRMRRVALQRIAHDLRAVYDAEKQLPPHLQACCQQLDEQQEKDGR
jgi:hypothetical protein